MVVQRRSRRTRRKRINLAAALQAIFISSEANAHYRRAFALEPGMLDAQFETLHVCKLWISIPRLLPATKHYSPPRRKHSEANFGLATLFERLGHSDEAVLRYRDALAADPDTEASFGIGRATEREEHWRRQSHVSAVRSTSTRTMPASSVALGAAFMQARRDDGGHCGLPVGARGGALKTSTPTSGIGEDLQSKAALRGSR